MLGEAGESRRIAGQEALAVADADHERTAEPGADQNAGIARTDHRQAVGALQKRQHGGDRSGQIVFEILGDEMGDDLGIRVAAEDRPFVLQLSFEGGVVLDDAVVDEDDGAVAADVGVGIAVVRGTMRRPARVADADAARGRLLGELAGQVRQPARALADVQARAGKRGDAGAVVAAIFQAAQAFEQDGLRLAGPDVADDAAHDGNLSAIGVRMGIAPGPKRFVEGDVLSILVRRVPVAARTVLMRGGKSGSSTGDWESVAR